MWLWSPPFLTLSNIGRTLVDLPVRQPSSTLRGSLCRVCVHDGTAVLVGYTGVLTLQSREVRARFFCLVLMSDDAMRKALEFCVALLKDLLESCNAVIGKF